MAAAKPMASRQRARQPMSVRVLLSVTVLAVALAWALTQALGFSASSPAGYWLGVVGGCAMLVVFLYPMRKRFAFMRGWGAAKPWFIAHMVCGIVGPLVILVHCGFQIGSVNAGVALTCTLLVAASGIVGRFVYIRIHHGLSGAHWTLGELQSAIWSSDEQVRSKLAFAPAVEQKLHAFQARLASKQSGTGARIGAFFLAPLRAYVVRAQCRRDLMIALKARAAATGWSASQFRRAYAKSRQLVDGYVDAVQRAAQLGAYERTFSWWHILHVPLVWLLVLSAIAHVVAVHAY